MIRLRRESDTATEGRTRRDCTVACLFVCFPFVTALLWLTGSCDGFAMSVKVHRVVCDEEMLPFRPGTFDLVISSMSLHWVNDLPGVFQQVKNVLKPDGLFLGAMLGGATLNELRSSFVVAETEREGGLSRRMSPLTEIGDVGNLLQRVGFALPTVDVETLTFTYSSPFVLMHDLRLMGECNAVASRRPTLPRDTLMAAAAAYRALYGNADGSVPATFQVVYFIGWVPHESQPKPLRRGSAKASLAQLLQMNPALGGHSSSGSGSGSKP